MNDLIDRQAAIDALEKVVELYPWRVPGDRDSYSQYNEAWNDAIGRAEIALEQLPSAQPEIIDIAKTTMAMAKTADMVAVVRCKDCKHWCINKRLDIPWCRNSHIDRGANDFCSYAERRTDEGD